MGGGALRIENRLRIPNWQGNTAHKKPLAHASHAEHFAKTLRIVRTPRVATHNPLRMSCELGGGKKNMRIAQRVRLLGRRPNRADSEQENRAHCTTTASIMHLNCSGARPASAINLGPTRARN